MENNEFINDRQPVEEEGLSIKDILYIIRKHIIAIAIFIIAGAGIGFVGGKVKNMVSPSYTANATMMVTVNAENIQMTQAYSYSSYISKTFVVWIQEDAVIDTVAANNDTTSKKIRNGLSVSLKSDTLIVSLSYTSKDKASSVKVLNEIVDSAINTANLKTTVNGTETAKYPLLYGNISSVTKASDEKVTEASSTKKFFVVGAAAGVVLAAGYVFLREIFDNSFKSNDEIERELGIPVLADIPFYDMKELESDSNKKGGK